MQIPAAGPLHCRCCVSPILPRPRAKAALFASEPRLQGTGTCPVNPRTLHSGRGSSCLLTTLILEASWQEMDISQPALGLQRSGSLSLSREVPRPLTGSGLHLRVKNECPLLVLPGHGLSLRAGSGTRERGPEQVMSPLQHPGRLPGFQLPGSQGQICKTYLVPGPRSQRGGGLLPEGPHGYGPAAAAGSGAGVVAGVAEVASEAVPFAPGGLGRQPCCPVPTSPSSAFPLQLVPQAWGCRSSDLSLQAGHVGPAGALAREL